MKSARGFTLIELLITIAIISILATLFIAVPTGVTKRARDSKRKSDLRQYQTSLETYAGKNNGLYPKRFTLANVTLCADLSLTGCPSDPKTGTAGFDYMYESSPNSPSDGSASATSYIMWTKEEVTNKYLVVCSDGKNKSQVDDDPNGSNGICPF